MKDGPPAVSLAEHPEDRGVDGGGDGSHASRSERRDD